MLAAGNMVLPEVSYEDISDMMYVLGESVGERKIFYRLGESELFQYANNNTVIGGQKMIDVIPRMVVEDQGFLRVGYEDLDRAVQYELFEGTRYKISCKKTIKNMIVAGDIIPVYSEQYSLPTCIPYIIQGTGKNARIFVNISDFVNLDAYGKYRVVQDRNYNALMSILFAAAVVIRTVRGNAQIPADLCDGIVLSYATMMTRTINSLVHMDPITQEKVKYLSAEFALIQMYGTAAGQQIFYNRFRKKYFPKLTPMITDALDNQFHLDSFDKLSLFCLELKRLYPSMRALNENLIFEKWIRLFGVATSMAIDYLGYHIYTICMVLFESPLISRVALEPVLEKSKGTDMYKRMQLYIGET